MSTQELRDRLKRDLSFSRSSSSKSLGGSSHGPSLLRSSKRCKSSDDGGFQRKVSFGHLDETVLFDKKASSSNLSLGVSVSNTSFGDDDLSSQGSANFRWGENGQLQQSEGANATWESFFPPPLPKESRWQCSLPNASLRTSSNMFLQPSTATSNAMRSIQQTTPSNNFPRRNCSVAQARLPTRCASPTPEDDCMETEDNGISTVAADFTMQPPRQPGRCESPIFGMPPPAFANSQLTTITTPTTTITDGGTTGTPEAHVFTTSPSATRGMIPPQRPNRSVSPNTVTPQSSFTLCKKS
jgi:hypothetical protein